MSAEPRPGGVAGGADMAARNREFYEPLWAGAKLQPPRRFNTWPLVQELCAAAPRRLEIGPGLRPRLPIAGTEFVDLSDAAVGVLNRNGGAARTGSILDLPLGDAAYDLVCACDILEHVEDDGRALAQIRRVLKPGGTLLLAVPLHRSAWNFFDDAVGHYRRYEPADLVKMLAAHGFTIERSAAYGMLPKSTRVLRWGLWWMAHHPERAMRWYNRFFMPIGLWLQKPLHFVPGLTSDPQVADVILVCRG